MALLRNRITGRKILLKSFHVFGRNKTTANTILAARDVSQIHASARWDGFNWEFKDLSRNGSWLSGYRLTAGESVYPEKGDTIRFGAVGRSAWEIIDLNPPEAALMPLDPDGPVIEIRRFQVLPHEKRPDISIYMSEKGQWVYESENRVAGLNDGDVVRGDSNIWHFFNPGPVEITFDEKGAYFAGEEIKYHFSISTDEEHVFLKITFGEKAIDLGERVHHYLLLTLARLRLRDAKNGDDPSNQGWVETERLSDMLGLGLSHLNILIFRARKQVYGALPDVLNFPQVIQRRVGSLRFGCPCFQIVSGSRIEGKMSWET